MTAKTAKNPKIEVVPTGKNVVGRVSTYPEYALKAGEELLEWRGTKPAAERRAERLRRVLEHSGSGGLPFALWLLSIDGLCISKLGVGLFDLPDMMTRDAFEDGVSPGDFFQEQVMDVAREEGYPG